MSGEDTQHLTDFEMGPIRHRAGDPHQYRLECIECGQSGVIRVTIDPERVDDPTGRTVPGYEAGHRAALHMASKRIRALPKVHGAGIAISDEALSEREAIADFLDELSG